MIIRVRSATGMARIELADTDTLSILTQKVREYFKLQGQSFSIGHGPDLKSMFTPRDLPRSVTALKIKHGDILQVVHEKSQVAEQTEPEPPTVVLDEVDISLAKQDGKIIRKRDSHYCHHGETQRCIHCVPLEPYDEKVLNDAKPPIKFLSFHSYLRKLTAGKEGLKTAVLEDIRCRIKPGCVSHAPWPEGICTQCQPGAISLSRQTFRHVDYVQFEDKMILQQFIESWRRSGTQRAGFLIGRYEEYPHVPLGIQAVITAIYEPPQTGQSAGLDLHLDPNDAIVESVTTGLGLQRVGWIFTDLAPEKSGTVQFTRTGLSEDTPFISATEILNAALFQTRYPNACATRYSSSGRAGSKFVTVIVSGDATNNVGLTCYQATNQATALVRDEVLLPSNTAGRMAVKSSSAEQYVPDVFYQHRDQYNNEIKEAARPSFPVEYLIVDMPSGSQVDGSAPTFFNNKQRPFPIENRKHLGEDQSVEAIASFIAQPGTFLSKVSDFHFLLYLATNDMFGISIEVLKPLLAAVKDKDAARADQWQKQAHQWETITVLMSHNNEPAPVSPPQPRKPISSASASATARAPTTVARTSTPPARSAAKWVCKHCTYANTDMSLDQCEVCALPR